MKVWVSSQKIACIVRSARQVQTVLIRLHVDNVCNVIHSQCLIDPLGFRVGPRIGPQHTHPVDAMNGHTANSPGEALVNVPIEQAGCPLPITTGIPHGSLLVESKLTRAQSESKLGQQRREQKPPGTKAGRPPLIYDGSEGMLRKCTFCRTCTAQVKLLWIPAWMLGYNENILEKWGLMCKRCYVRRRDWDEAILVLECEWPWDQRSMCVGPNSAIMSNASDALHET